MDFPASKLERGALFARAGLKVGTNYAKYYAQRTLADKEQARRDKSALHRDNANDIFRQFAKLRGTALKLAQSLSLDNGALPDEFAEVMAQAQYQVPPMNRALVRSRIKQELGAYPEQAFARFTPEAVAAASIGQVHRARLKDGTPVAVKIQYPNMRQTIDSDLALARTLFGPLIGDSADAYFAEVRQKLLEETDYINEGRQLEQFSQLYQHPAIVTPRLVGPLTTERVLTMTFVEGQHLGPYLQGAPPAAERDAYGQLLWDFFHQQVADGSYAMHADLHPGNFLFRADGKLGMLDFGCVKHFPKSFIHTCMALLEGHLADDPQGLKQLYYREHILDEAQSDNAAEEEAFAYFRTLGKTLVQPYRSERFDFGQPDYRSALNQLFRSGPKVQPRVSPHFIFLNKVQAGLYSLLMKLGARVDTRASRRIVARLATELAPAQPSGA